MLLLKAAGYKKEEATSILEDWVVKFTSADSRYSIQQRKANTRNVIESVYGSEKDYQLGVLLYDHFTAKRRKATTITTGYLVPVICVLVLRVTPT